MCFFLMSNMGRKKSKILSYTPRLHKLSILHSFYKKKKKKFNGIHSNLCTENLKSFFKLTGKPLHISQLVHIFLYYQKFTIEITFTY